VKKTIKVLKLLKMNRYCTIRTTVQSHTLILVSLISKSWLIISKISWMFHLLRRQEKNVYLSSFLDSISKTEEDNLNELFARAVHRDIRFLYLRDQI